MSTLIILSIIDDIFVQIHLLKKKSQKMKYFLIIVYFTFPHWGSPVGNGERLPHAESGEMANAYGGGSGDFSGDLG